MPKFPSWLVSLKPSILLPTLTSKDDPNGNMQWRLKLIPCWRIKPGTWFPNLMERTFWSFNGSIRPNLPLKVLLSDIKHTSWWRYFLNKKPSTTLKPLLPLQRWTLSDWFFPLLLILDGRLIIWMWRVFFFTTTYLNKFTWNNHLAFWQIPIWHVDSRIRFMVWTRLLDMVR